VKQSEIPVALGGKIVVKGKTKMGQISVSTLSFKSLEIDEQRGRKKRRAKKEETP